MNKINYIFFWFFLLPYILLFIVKIQILLLVLVQMLLMIRLLQIISPLIFQNNGMLEKYHLIY